jgi:hypothetical protein
MVDCDNSAMGNVPQLFSRAVLHNWAEIWGFSIDEGTRQTDHPRALTAMA